MKKTVLNLLAVALLVLNTSCGDALKPTWDYQVDNPLDKEIMIKIDDKEYAIPAQTTKEIKITQGKHTLTYNGSSVNFVTKVNSQKSVTIMNPTLSNYMMHAYFYISEKARNNDVTALYEKHSHEYESAEGTVSIPVIVINSLFMEKTQYNWTFGLEQVAKEEIRSTVPGGKKRAVYKLYREADYRKELAEELPDGVIFPVNARTLSELPPYVFPADSLMCDCDVANEYIRELETKWNEIIADPSDIFQEVGKLRYDALMEEQSGKLKEQCTTQYNPERDDTKYKETMSKLNKVMNYLTNSTSFIVK